MKRILLDVVILVYIIFIFTALFLFCYYVGKGIINCISCDSSPVEELQHKEIVTIVDSILDSRFGVVCCPEHTFISSSQDSLKQIILPKD